MEPTSSHKPLALDLAQSLLIVVGAHPKAELHDRPLAYSLLSRIRQWVDGRGGPGQIPLQPLVISDLWYMNHSTLQKRPTISLGAPAVNALSAYYWHKRGKTSGGWRAPSSSDAPDKTSSSPLPPGSAQDLKTNRQDDSEDTEENSGAIGGEGGQMVIQIDPEFIDLRVCVWGQNHPLTAAALSHFTEHYLEAFLRASATQVEPRED